MAVQRLELRLMVHQLLGNSLDTMSPPGEVVTTQAVVAPMSEGWTKFPIVVNLGKDKLMDRCFIMVWLDKAEGISWKSVSNLSFYYKTGIMNDNGKWTYESEKSFRISIKEPVEALANCAPENVNNGYSRIVDADQYEWVSDPAQTLPQWIELEFKEPTKINSISTVFNTDLSNPGTCWIVKRAKVPQCVKDYEIDVLVDSKWIKIAKVTNNFMRKRIHYFDAMMVEKIRVTVMETWGDKSARIQEIRACFES